VILAQHKITRPDGQRQGRGTVPRGVRRAALAVVPDVETVEAEIAKLLARVKA